MAQPLRRKLIWFALALVLAAAMVILLVRPEAGLSAPDHLELGTVAMGSKVEFSACLLTGPQRSAYERAFESVVSRLPSSWRDKLNRWHPVTRRQKSFVPIDLTTLKPVVAAPDFLHVTKVEPEQRATHYLGRPFLRVHLEVNTTRVGEYRGMVTARLGDRWSTLPVHVAVREPASPARWLIASTPYLSDSTEHGTNFYPTTRLLSSLPANLDFRHALPAALDAYQLILLNEDALSDLKPEDVARLRQFVERGGRLVLAANKFFGDTILHANEVLLGHGLSIMNTETGGYVVATNIVADPLTRGVRVLQFHRPSPIQITDSSRAMLLARDAMGNGYVAVARPPGGGVIVVLAQSLWWLWLDEFKDGSDNIQMFKNMLRTDPEK